ncbi:MAG TPA: beta-ketoacyl synthase N-terminal-like domain-containing protein [Herpetosiphonaceae bacterium]
MANTIAGHICNYFDLHGGGYTVDGACSSSLVIVQHGGGGAPLARTLHLEAPAIDVCVVDVPIDQPEACDWILAEALAARGYSEAHYDAQGRRTEPLLQLLSLPTRPGELPLDSGDVLLVTGGGKGITAECALLLGQALLQTNLLGLPAPTSM